MNSKKILKEFIKSVKTLDFSYKSDYVWITTKFGSGVTPNVEFLTKEATFKFLFMTLFILDYVPRYELGSVLNHQEYEKKLLR